MAVSTAALLSCGYRLSGPGGNAGSGRSIAVPTFVNQTSIYRLEQRLTEAVRRELIRHTRYHVLPDAPADVVVEGEVLSFSAIPIIFNQQGRGSSYSILVDMKVKLTDSRSGEVVFQNDRWTFREVFELSQNSDEFVPEDTAAMERLSRQFASSLIASVLHVRP